MTEKASIILLTDNSGETINDVLKGIFCQKTSIYFDVQIIDSSSQDNTMEIVEKFPVRSEIIAKESFNHGETRNLGASLTDGDFLVYLSHDAIPTDQWLEPLVKSLKNNDNAAGVYSRQLPSLNVPLAVKRTLENEWSFGSKKPLENKIDQSMKTPDDFYRTFFFTDVSSCIKRKVWEIIPFRKCQIAEDMLWASDVLKAGYSTLYQPESMVFHAHVRKIRRHFNDNLNHAKTMKRLIIKDDIFGFNESSLDEKVKSSFIKKLSRPIDLPKMTFVALSQIFKDFHYILGKADVSPGKKLWNLWYSILWESSSVLGNYIGYKSKII